MPTMMVGMRETGPFSCPWQLSLGGEGCCWYSTPALLQPGDCGLATKSRMSEGRRELKGAPNQASKRRWRSSRAPGTQHVHTASRAHTPRPSDTHPDAISPRSEAACHAQPCEPAGAPPSSSALLCDDGASNVVVGWRPQCPTEHARLCGDVREASSPCAHPINTLHLEL